MYNLSDITLREFIQRFILEPNCNQMVLYNNEINENVYNEDGEPFSGIDEIPDIYLDGYRVEVIDSIMSETYFMTINISKIEANED